MQPLSRSRIIISLTAILSGTVLIAGCGVIPITGSSKRAETKAASTQSISVPGVVLQAFNQRHPGQQPQWEKKPYGYEAIFTENGQEYEVEYAPTGEWLETEYEVEAAQFSPAVLQRVSQQYPGSVVTKHEIELTPQGRFYEVEIKQQSGQERELYFDDRANPTPNSNEDL
jgi:hypothetical protein